MDTEAFDAAYKELNAEQKEAVDTIEGPVMVVAGPGTGKTQILTLRIANILLKTDTAPESILALTFTESGARAMRDRLRGYIGARAYRVPIYTFHAFADRLIQEYPEQYNRVIGGRAIGELERIEVLDGILSGGEFSLLRPIGAPQFYVPHIVSAIGTMKREYISPDAFARIIAAQEEELAGMEQYHEKGAHKGKVRGDYQKKERAIAKNRELLLVYRLYEETLGERRLYDFEDMIVETARALEGSEEFLRELQETYQYILADEHQDVNGSQNRLLELLASYHEQPNLFVVGDEKQAIYRFQGASLENFLYFEERFPKTKTIALTRNYRSGQTILDGAHSLITSESSPASELRVPLSAEAVSASVIESRVFPHMAAEDAWVVNVIANLDAPRSEIAVIVRTNKEVEAFAALLRKRNMPVSASAESDILSHPVLGEVRSLIGALSSEEALFRVLHGAYWEIPAGDVVRVLAARRHDRPLSELVRSSKFLEEAGVENIAAVLRVGEVLDAVRKKEAVLAPHRLLEELLNASGFLSHVLKVDAAESGRVVRRLYDEIEGMVSRGEVETLADVSARLAAYKEHGLALQAPFIGGEEEAVTVLTAHKAKGLEFAHVFVPHLSDRLWGGRRRPEYFDIPITAHVDAGAFDRLDDERRLFYVAMTRAKEGLYLSYSETNAEGAEFFPSRLYEEIDSVHMSECEANGRFDPVESLAPGGSAKISAEVIQALFFERGLSATALNNYLESPWQYLYRNVLRIPEVRPLHMLFGTALHGVMEEASRWYRDDGAKPGVNEVRDWLSRELGKLPITKEEAVSLHEKGLAALVPYMEAAVFSPNAREELKLRVMLPTDDPSLPEIPLTGMLDRIDFDEAGQAVLVTDYKSGKPKTRGQIEGTTKDSNGGYKRQLVFYALLLDLYDDERYRCREGVISFLEPDSKGRVHEERFSITDEEIAALREEIVRVATEITNGSFLEEPCDPSVCEYCDLAERFLE